MEHRDLVGYEIAVGDHVAYPTQSGSSSRMCVAQVVDIIEYPRRIGFYDADTGVRGVKEVMKWKVRLQPLHWTDYRSTYDYVRTEEGNYQRVEREPRQVTVEKVENLVKVAVNGEEG